MLFCVPPPYNTSLYESTLKASTTHHTTPLIGMILMQEHFLEAKRLYERTDTSCRNPTNTVWQAFVDARREEFCVSRGWKVASYRQGFGKEQLRPKPKFRSFNESRTQTEGSYLDHTECFIRRLGRGGYGPPVALLSHSYIGDENKLFVWAWENSLACEILPWSWYVPGGAIAALYTRLIP